MSMIGMSRLQAQKRCPKKGLIPQPAAADITGQPNAVQPSTKMMPRKTRLA